MPQCDLPKYLDHYKEDAREHLRCGVALHQEVFGAKPRNVALEGSVSQDILAAIAETGIEWIATDEEILSHSTDQFVHRTSSNLINRPEMLYRPVAGRSRGAELSAGDLPRPRPQRPRSGSSTSGTRIRSGPPRTFAAKCTRDQPDLPRASGDSRPLIPDHPRWGELLGVLPRTAG